MGQWRRGREGEGRKEARSSIRDTAEGLEIRTGSPRDECALANKISDTIFVCPYLTRFKKMNQKKIEN